MTLDLSTTAAGGVAGGDGVDAPGLEVAWRHRHLLDVDGLTGSEIELIMQTADAMKGVLSRPIPKVPALRGRNVTILFYEASTRTRVSFEVAAKNLSADVVNIATATSSVTKGESFLDTLRTIEALGGEYRFQSRVTDLNIATGPEGLRRVRKKSALAQWWWTPAQAGVRAAAEPRFALTVWHPALLLARRRSVLAQSMTCRRALPARARMPAL